MAGLDLAIQALRPSDWLEENRPDLNAHLFILLRRRWNACFQNLLPLCLGGRVKPGHDGRNWAQKIAAVTILGRQTIEKLLALCLRAGPGLRLGGRARQENSRPRNPGGPVGGPPVTMTVIEPHLSTPKNPVAVAYLAFPAPAALAATLGPGWAMRVETIEFRALDGYVSRIGAARLTSGKAYLAFARADRSPFTVDNLSQNEKNVPLGPYYLGTTATIPHALRGSTRLALSGARFGVLRVGRRAPPGGVRSRARARPLKHENALPDLPQGQRLRRRKGRRSRPHRPRPDGGGVRPMGARAGKSEARHDHARAGDQPAGSGAARGAGEEVSVEKQRELWERIRPR